LAAHEDLAAIAPCEAPDSILMSVDLPAPFMAEKADDLAGVNRPKHDPPP
jgi:hypothetical protein